MSDPAIRINVQEHLAAIEQFLRNSTSADSVAVTEPRLLSGGAIQENWRISIALRRENQDQHIDAVLRLDAPVTLDVSLTRQEEYHLLKRAFAAGVTVPEPLWQCSDAAVLGQPFFISRYCSGIAAGHRVVKDLSLGGNRQQLTRRLGAELATIHALRPELAIPVVAQTVSRADFAESHRVEAPVDHAALRFVAESRAYLDTCRETHPVLEYVLRWLEREAPDAAVPVLCHGDFRTGNYLVDSQGLSAVLDWEFSGPGHPLQDIGWFCARCWRFGRPALEAGGVGHREDFYQGYEAVGGGSIDRGQVAYWEVLAHMKWAVIALKQAARLTPGDRHSLLLALTGHIVPELEYEMLLMTRGG